MKLTNILSISMIQLAILTLIAPSWVHCSTYNVLADNDNGGGGASDPILNTLKLVIMIHRHGDRTPIETYPRDPYRNASKYWPDGWGQLTLNGKKRMYQIGRYLSKRYGPFLGKSPREVSARSSSTDRCLESAQLVLAGLYPPENRWKWNQDLGQRWQPFPIQTVLHEQDGMLNPGSKCHRAEQIIQEIYHSNQVVQYYNEMKSTLLYVQDNTGYETPIDLIKAEEIFDSLLIERMSNLKLPVWVDDNVYNKLKDIAAKTFIFSGLNRQIQKLRAGLLLGDIWKHIKEIQLNPDKRFFIYATHDTQLSVFLSALDAYNQLAPPFGASILIELHQQNQTSAQYLKVYYLNVTESENPYLLPLKSCLEQERLKEQFKTNGHQEPNQCTVSSFYESIKDLIPDDWQRECQNPLPYGPSEEMNLYFVLSTIGACIFMMFSMIYFWMALRRYSTAYRLLPLN